MIKVSNIESIIKFDTIDIGISELHTLGGDIYLINMKYEELIKFWHDALETSMGLFIARKKSESVNMN